MTTVVQRAGVVVAAVAAAEIVYLLVRHAAGVDLSVPGQGPVGPAAVAITAALAGLLGWALLAVLERTARKGRTIWVVIAAAVLLVSLLGPLGAASAGAVAGLIALHLTVGAVLLAGLPR
ncbi:DUF6069 family protein [Dactylosporangium sp. NPDC051541]|uniref:DUF6069 family protein n=1 Tax=Dactylosporangium sp. NPDC051541 TaxID=3363977 RepID=UPI0037B105F0